jgi:hypothetical protein
MLQRHYFHAPRKPSGFRLHFSQSTEENRRVVRREFQARLENGKSRGELSNNDVRSSRGGKKTQKPFGPD